jgi:hypothetical protein
MGVYTLKKSIDESLEEMLYKKALSVGKTLKNQEINWAVPFVGGTLLKNNIKFKILDIRFDNEYTLFVISHKKMNHNQIKQFILSSRGFINLGMNPDYKPKVKTSKRGKNQSV